MKVMHIVAPVLCLILVVNVFIYMILTSSVSNEEGEKVNVVSDSVALDGRDGAYGEYARKMTTSKPSKTGLYHESSEIVELWSAPEVDRFVQPADKQPKIVVFYAAWCPHCRHFAPTFIEFAKKLTNVGTNLENQITEGGLDRVPRNDSGTFRISFGAVNCPDVSSACEKQKIDAYPTIIAFNIPENVMKPQKFVGNVKDLEKLLRRTIFKHGELDDSKLISVGKNSHTSNLNALLRPMQSHDTKGTTRLDEAWSSFVYFLHHELPTVLEIQHLVVLRGMFILLEHIVSLEETHHSRREVTRGRRRFLQASQLVLQRYAQHTSLPAKKVIDVVQEHLPAQQIQWKVCGKYADDNPRRRLLFSRFFDRDSGSSGALRGSRSEGDAKGYSCGLWMLFHFFSVYGQETQMPASFLYLLSTHDGQNSRNGSSARDITPTTPLQMRAADVRDVIHGFVQHFFRCYTCRSHFLYAFDHCYFQHCTAIPSLTPPLLPSLSPRPPDSSVTNTLLSTGSSGTRGSEVLELRSSPRDIISTMELAEEYQHLQFWLFRLHNLVTTRIVLEKDQPVASTSLASSSSSNHSAATTTTPEVLERVLEGKLWPRRRQCPTCFTQPSARHSIETYRTKVLRRRQHQQAHELKLQRRRDGGNVSVSDGGNGADRSSVSSSESSVESLGGSDPQHRLPALRFDSDDDLEWFLQHLLERFFVRDSALAYVRRAYAL